MNDTHRVNLSNPHSVTKAQVGLANVDNTSDATKNNATATLTNKTLTSPIINVGSDADGDMYYRSAGNLTRLPKGVSGQILTQGATYPAWSSGTGVTDVNAIHDNVASEISAITEKTVPVLDDIFIIEDSADSNNKKKLKLLNTRLDIPNNQTGTSYTLVLGDTGKTVWMNNASANTLTIPANSSVAFPVNTVITVFMEGAGTTTIQGATGVTINGVSAGSVAISNQYKPCQLIKRTTDTWIVFGGLT